MTRNFLSVSNKGTVLEDELLDFIEDFGPMYEPYK